MKSLAAKAAVDKECEKLEKISAWNLTKVRSREEVIDEARTSGRKSSFCIINGHMSFEKNAELEAKHQKHKGRVVFARWSCTRRFWLLRSVHWTRRHLKWTVAKNHINIQICQFAMDKQQTQYQIIPKWKCQMFTNFQKIPNRSVQTFGFVYHDTNGQNHGPVWKTQSFLLKRICTVILWQDCYGKGILRKSPLKHGLGEGFQLGILIRTSWKRIILICVCGWHKIDWKDTKSWSDVESTQQRSRFGRTNIFLGSCIPGMHSTRMPSKQRNCGQLLSHVWIANFQGENRRASILWESSYFFMVSWYGRSCKEIRGVILWVCKQDDSTTPQNI